jgi:polyferredoxin
MPPAERSRGLHRHRRFVQLVFLAVFFVLLTLTVWPLGHVFLGAFLTADPLIALSTLAGGVWLAPMALALLVLASPLVLGRAFCGYVCPMGTIVELTSVSPETGSRLPARFRQALRKTPLFILVGSAGLLVFGSGTFLVLDPLALLTRSSTTLLYPLADRVIRLVGDVAYLAAPLRVPVDVVTSALTGRLVFSHPLVFGMQLGIFAMLVGILALSRLEARLWCRHLCPLGALLGLVGRAAVSGRVVDADACISCGTCARVCPLDAVGEDFHSTDASRCQLGLECADSCPVGAISFGPRPRKVMYSPSRRALLGSSALALLGGFFTFTALGRAQPPPTLIRPPGARDRDSFLALCSRCGQCMKVCPMNVLQPQGPGAGLESLFTPHMDFRRASCYWGCNECGKVCPTGAIQALTLPVKRRTTIGRAYIDRNRCIPWAEARTCLVCQELCPVPDKAVVLKRAEVLAPDGRKVRLGRPEVVTERCIGCGVCEENCPAATGSAVLVRGI